MSNMPQSLNSLNEKVNFLIENIRDEKIKDLINNLKIKISDITKELTTLMEEIFFKEREVSLNLINMNNFSE